MNIKQKLLVAGVSLFLLGSGNVWAAASEQGCISSDGRANGCSGASGGESSGAGSASSVPEIDAGSGLSAMVVLSGATLLAWKRVRENRSV